MFLHNKENQKQNKKTTYRVGEHIPTDISDKGLISKIYKVLTKLNTKSQTTQFKNG